MVVCFVWFKSYYARSTITHTFVHIDLYGDKIRCFDTSLLHPDRNPMNPMKKPKIGNVRPVDRSGNVESILGQSSTARVPRYLVESLRKQPPSLSYTAVNDSRVKIIGFGERFLPGKIHGTNFEFHYQAPELVLFSQLSPSADIWSLGCLVSCSVFLILNVN